MTRSRYRVLQNPSPHFLTAPINQSLPLFTRPATVNIVLASWRFLQRESGFQLYGYVIQENHPHLISASADFSRDMQRFKAYTTKQIIGHLQQSGSARVLELLALLKRPHKTESEFQVWEEGCHPQLIESEAAMRQKLNYIHLNPVTRGYLDLPEHWRNSSTRNYAGMDGLIEVVKHWRGFGEAGASEGWVPKLELGNQSVQASGPGKLGKPGNLISIVASLFAIRARFLVSIASLNALGASL